MTTQTLIILIMVAAVIAALIFMAGHIYGHRQSTREILDEVSNGAAVIIDGRALVGSVMSYADWLNDPVYPRVDGGVVRMYTTQAVVEPVEDKKPDTLTDPKAAYQARMVAVLGIHESKCYEHPFLNGATQG